MKKITMNYMDTYNAIVGAIVTCLNVIFGEHWLLFAIFLIFNVIDWITGWMKARINHRSNSIAGMLGVIKKLGYWLMILVAFIASAMFIEIGQALHVNLEVTQLLGYFVLASLCVNELRSIIENFVESGFNVPKILVNGLEVADKVINKKE